MKKSVILLSLTLILFSACHSNKKDSVSFEAMNTFMTLTSYGKNSSEANHKAYDTIKNLESLISTTSSSSEVYKLNESETGLNVSEETFFLTDYALKMAEKTKGAFNPCLFPVTSAWGFTTSSYRVPSQSEIMELLKSTDYTEINLSSEKNNFLVSKLPSMKFDFGAIGKGYAGDKVIQVLKNEGIKNAILDLGGNIQLLGTKPDGTDWKVGIRDPEGNSACIGISVSNKAVITSGGYERFFTADDGNKYIHIFDGKTGYPVNNNIASVTIISETGIYGDALSTAIFVMGLEKASHFWKQEKDFEMIIITTDRKVFYTSGLKDSIKLLSDFETAEIIQ